MNKELTKVSSLINEISMGPFGSDIKVENFISEGVPVLDGSNLTDFKLVENQFRYVSAEKARTYKKAIAKRGDIVITHRGTLGQVSYIPEDSKFEEYVISQSQFRVSLDRSLVDPIYFTYYFHTREGQKRLLANKCHVGVPALAQATTNFRNIEIPLPSIVTQQKIASVLSSLDSKIELNNRINAELEAMAKTIYDYWFVQFDFPDADGRPYKSSGGKMVWNDELKRDVPEGWGVKPLSEIVEVSNESINPFEHAEMNFRHYSIPAFDELGTFKIERGVEIKSNKYQIKSTDVLVSKLNPWFSRVIYSTDDSNLISSTEFVVWRTNGTAMKNYLYMIARDVSFMNYCTQSAAGTSNSHKRVNPTVMMKYKIVFNEKIANLFGQILGSTIKMLALKKIENTELSHLRDWLLPMLMNGQVRVGDYL